MSAAFDAAVEKAARELDQHLTERTVESGCSLRCGYDGDDMDVHLATDMLLAVGLPALLERVEAAEGALADVWDAGATAAGGYGHEDGWTHDMSPYLDNPYRAALNGADHGA